MINVNDNFTKDQIINIVDAAGELKFHQWYKNTLMYKNQGFVVTLIPDYRDTCRSVETLKELLLCEDYMSVGVFKGEGKPFEWEWYSRGDNR